MNLKNKKILITGATGGIGNCLVEKFNSLGSTIVASGTNEDKLNKLKEKFSNITIKNGTSYLQYTNHRSIRLDSNDTVNGTMIQIKFGLDPRGMATF